jgi:hypothetical protein
MRNTTITVRRAILKAAVAATAGAIVVAAGSAAARPSAGPAMKPAGYVTIESCDAATGGITYAPGLTSNAAANDSVLSATLYSCQNTFNGATAGTGSLSATLSGTASLTGISLGGSFTITWPAASHFNPSSGTVQLHGLDADGAYIIGGSITSGAFTGSVISSPIAFTNNNPGADGTAAHPITSQQFLGFGLSVSRNNG